MEAIPPRRHEFRYMLLAGQLPLSWAGIEGNAKLQITIGVTWCHREVGTPIDAHGHTCARVEN